jgi:hypothetical protein
MASKRRTLDTLAPGPLPGQLALFPSSDGQRDAVGDPPDAIGAPLAGHRGPSEPWKAFPRPSWWDEAKHGRWKGQR